MLVAENLPAITQDLVAVNDQKWPSHPLLDELVENAKLALEQKPFPTSKNEEWKYTSLKSIEKTSVFSSAPQMPKFTIEFNGQEYIITKAQEIGSAYFSTIASLEGAHLERFAAALSNKVEKDYFPLVNLASSTGGLYIYISSGATLENLVLSVKLPTGLSKYQVFLFLEEGAKFSLSEIQSGSDDSVTIVSREIHLAKASNLSYEIIQINGLSASQIGDTKVYQAEDSISTNLTFSSGGKIVRNNLSLFLNSERCLGNMNGLYLASTGSLIDNHTLVVHDAPNSESNELYKGIVSGKGTAVFNGKILVQPDAQKTNAFQNNRNLLMSDDAAVFAKPQLEIFADDVKCSHGATTGALEEESIFYLRSRGLSETSAKVLLTAAYANEIVEKTENQKVKELLSKEVERWLSAEAQ